VKANLFSRLKCCNRESNRKLNIVIVRQMDSRRRPMKLAKEMNVISVKG